MIRRYQRYVKIGITIGLLILMQCMPCTAADADKTDAGKIADEDTIQSQIFTLGEVEVAGRPEDTQNVTTEKITSKEMRLFDRNNIADAVNLKPGVTLSEFGARNEKMVYVRGFDIKHVPIFLDGMPIYVPYDGYPDLSRYNTYNLSEIVVSKGFSSVLYGPNTMGGVINMVSRKPVKKFEFTFNEGYSTGNEFQSYANFGSNQGNWYIEGGGSYDTGDHFNVSHNFTPTATQGSGARVNSYHTDKSGDIKIGLTPNDTDEYAVSYMNQQADKGVPPYTGTDPSQSVKYWRWPYWNTQSVYTNTKTVVADRNYLKTNLFYDTFQNSLYSYDNASYTTMTKKYAFKSYYDDYTYGGSMELGSWMLPANLIKAAVHFKEDVHREHNEGNPIQQFEDRIISLGLEDTVNFTQRIYSIVGASYDMQNMIQAQDLTATNTLKDMATDNTSAFNPQAGLFYKLTDTDTLHTTVAEKSRLPSIKDRYSYRLGTALPNPDLKAEKSTNYEAGYQGFFLDKFTLESNLFYSDISDFILLKTIPDPSNPGKTLTQNQNVGNVHQYGAEFGVSGRLLPSLKSGVNYTYIQYENKSGTDQLLDIPNNKVFGYLQYFLPIEGLSLLGSAEYNGSRYSSSDAVRVAGSYTLMNTKIMYDLPHGFSLEGGVSNITDANWELDEGYPLAGRTFFLNLTYHFESDT